MNVQATTVAVHCDNNDSDDEFQEAVELDQHNIIDSFDVRVTSNSISALSTHTGGNAEHFLPCEATREGDPSGERSKLYGAEAIQNKSLNSTNISHETLGQIDDKSPEMMTNLIQQVEALQQQLTMMCHRNISLEKSVINLQEGGHNNPIIRTATPSANQSGEHQNMYADHRQNNTQQTIGSRPPVRGDNFTSMSPTMMYAHNALVQKPYDLPEFSGEADNWVVFIAAFRQSTEAFGYGPLQNLLRLQKCLKGDARESVRYLLTDPDNIEELLEDLEFRYGRPDQLIESQTARIYEFKPIDERHIDRFIEFSSVVQNTVAYLNKDTSRHILGETALMKALVMKLPPTKQLQWAEFSMTLKHRATAVDFSAWLKRLARCVATLPKSTSINNSTPAPLTPPRYANPPQSARYGKGHHVLRVDHQQSHSTGCGMCNNGHRTIDCAEFKACSVAERWKAARELKLCFGCLRNGHMFDDCRSKHICPIEGCTRMHHCLLHQQDENDQHADGVLTSTAANTDGRRQNPFAQHVPTTSNILSCRKADQLSLLFRVIPVKLYGTKHIIETFALLDDGSSLTVLETSLADELGLNGQTTPLTMQFVGDNRSTEQSQTINLDISGVFKKAKRFTMLGVRTAADLKLPTQTINMSDLASRFRHLRGLPIHNYSEATPRLLIGLDNAHLGVPSAVRSKAMSEPIAYKTKLGWIVFGSQRCSFNGNNRILHCHSQNKETLEELDLLVKAHYTVENFGCKVPERLIESDEDARARHILETTTVRNGARFQTGLLWRTDSVNLPDSYEMARRRLATVERKMRDNEQYAKRYRDEIEGYVTKGYATKISTKEAQSRDHRTWYLPHFGVQNAHKPDRFRLVFDAAAAVRGTSLNSSLLKGPDFNESMVGILFRFRMRRVAVCGDIAEMFHQILVQPSDRQSQRFLWTSDTTKGQPDEYQMNVMTFGATCSPASAQFVKNRNADEHAIEFPEAAKAIREAHYVDDYVASFDTEAEAIRVTKDVVEVHRRGGFTLRKFVSNSRTVLEAIVNDGSTTTNNNNNVNMQLDASMTSKILGMRWRIDEDAFYYEIHRPVPDTKAPTKREILRYTMSVYDPFGFLGEFLLHAKVLLQDLWRTGTEWDEPVPLPIAERWHAWRREIIAVENLRIPRCYSKHMTTSVDIQLHVFADASEQAFSAVAYWRINTITCREVAFIVGKTRCAPLKPLSVPRLELQAAVLAARLVKTIRDCHDVNISRLVMWSDSRTVLHWIRSDKRNYKPFVAHRVAEIIDNVGSSSWRWIPTKQNVADDATRVPAQPKFDENSRWLRGPAFLRDDEDKWPIEPIIEQESVQQDSEEIRGRFVGMTVGTKRDSIIDVTRFSKLSRICRSFAWALRFVHNTRHRTAVRHGGELSATEIQHATWKLCKITQIKYFAAEYYSLAQGGQVERSSPLAVLMPYMDEEGLMRLYGRTDLAQSRFLSAEAQRPILLPKDARFTELIVQDQHARMGHQLEDATICAIRQRYWVPSLRTLVRRIANNCLICKFRNARPNPPLAGQLPVDRLTPYVNPFTYTGLDFFGPVFVTVGRRREKRWIALFTCLTIRAVHMEVAQDLSSDACLLCIRNFCNTRGVPTRIRSDCGTNFVGADGEIRNMNDFLDGEVIGKAMATKGVDWVFNCPGNPEAGGVWERLVQSAKRVLRVTLKETAPQVETLRSHIIEAANIINSRPLTHVPVSPSDTSPITPNHFLLGRMNATTVPVTIDQKQLCSRKQWRVLQQLNNQFWRQWVNDYLPELTRRTKLYADVGVITIGSLVLVCDADQSRNQWQRGRVEKVVIGTDGRVRTALVRTATGTIRRPVSKLALLDVEEGEPSADGLTGPGMSPTLTT